MEPFVADCFPPTPIYITAGMLAAMLMTVMSKVEDIHDKGRKITYKGFSTILLVLVTIPFMQLVLMVAKNTTLSQCEDQKLLLRWHFLTLLPLLVGIASWVVRVSRVRIRNPLDFG